MNLESVGLGLALTHIKFNVKTRRVPYAYGFEVLVYAKFSSSVTEEQKKCMEVWAQANGFSVLRTTEMYGDTLYSIIDALEPFNSLMRKNDLNNIKRIQWLRENPIPKTLWRDDGTRRKVKTGRNWKKFMYWVEAWDAFCESLKE